MSLHVGASPHAFNVAWFGTERISHELGADIGEGLVSQHLNVLRIIAEEPEIRNIVLKEFAPAADCHLEVAVVAAADNAVDDVRTLLSDIYILSAAYSENGCLRCKVKETFCVIERPEARNQCSVTIDCDDLACTILECGHFFLERLCFLFVKHSFISALVNLSVEQSRVDFLVPYEQRIYHCVDFLSALEALCIGIDTFEFNPGSGAFPCEQIDENSPVGGGISVECYDLVFCACLFDYRCSKLLRHSWRSTIRD